MHPLTAPNPSLSVEAQQYLTAAYAPKTKAAYQLALQRFEALGYAIPATPPQVVEFLTQVQTVQGKRPQMATLSLWLAGIGKAHELSGYANPCQHPLVKEVFRGMKRTHGTAQRQARPLLQAEVVKMVTTPPVKTVKVIRDTVLILFGFTGMFRVSELVGIQLEDLLEHEEGILVRVRRSKTDPEGYGRQVGIPRARDPEGICPVKALNLWLDVLKPQGITQGPVLRNVDRRNGQGGVIGTALTTRSVNRILKFHAKQVGIDPTLVSGHSLRAGAATTLAKAGVDLWKVQQQGGWKDTRMLVERYIRNARLLADNAMANIW